MNVSFLKVRSPENEILGKSRCLYYEVVAAVAVSGLAGWEGVWREVTVFVVVDPQHVVLRRFPKEIPDCNRRKALPVERGSRRRRLRNHQCHPLAVYQVTTLSSDNLSQERSLTGLCSSEENSGLFVY